MIGQPYVDGAVSFDVLIIILSYSDIHRLICCKVGSAYARIIPKEDINGRCFLGKVDISMRVKGSKGKTCSSKSPNKLLESRAGAGRVYFTSIRKEKGQPFTICKF